MDNLKGGSKHRLAKMRAYVFRWNQDTKNPARRKFTGSAIEARGHGIGSIRVDAHGPCFADDGESASVPACVLAGLRDAGMAEKIVGLRHTGWFKDTAASESYAGRVWQLPARDGQTQFLAGYEDKDADYCQLDASAGRLSIFDTARDAAHAADDLARIHAEREREHDERWQEASAASDEREQARGTVKDLRHVARDIIRAWRDQLKTGPLSPAVCSILRADLAEARDGMREAIEEARKATARIAELDMAGEF